jgi:hypothetical protein
MCSLHIVAFAPFEIKLYCLRRVLPDLPARPEIALRQLRVSRSLADGLHAERRGFGTVFQAGAFAAATLSPVDLRLCTPPHG